MEKESKNQKDSKNKALSDVLLIILLIMGIAFLVLLAGAVYFAVKGNTVAFNITYLIVFLVYLIIAVVALVNVFFISSDKREKRLYPGNEKFSVIDDLKPLQDVNKWGEEKAEYYEAILRKITEFYRSSDGIGNITRQMDIRSLYDRKAVLEKKITPPYTIISIIVTIGFSVITGFFVGSDKTVFDITLFVCAICALVFLIIALALQRNKKRSMGVHIDMVNQYEVELLSRKIYEVEGGFVIVAEKN